MSNLHDVWAVRKQLVMAGYKFCEVLTNEKKPRNSRWQLGDNVEAFPSPVALNTGILASGLRAIDVDVDDLNLCNEIEALARECLGEGYLRRFRTNSPRFLMLYRSLEEVPPKKITTLGQHGKIEALGDGQQFVAYGGHTSGVDLLWAPCKPHEQSAFALQGVSERALAIFFTKATPLLGAKISSSGEAPAGQGPKDNPYFWVMARGYHEDLASALSELPNDDTWDTWSNVGMAVWAATEGSREGFGLFLMWSAKSDKFSVQDCKERWSHWRHSPPEHTGARWLYGQVNKIKPSWEKPTDNDFSNIQPLIDKLKEESQKRSTASLDSYDEIEPVLDSRDFVEGLLQEETLAVVYGDSNAGKTFWTTDLALHVAAGLDWNGRRIRPGAVVYCALEGNAGLNNRIVAWRRDRELSGVPFYVWRDPLDLCSPTPKLDLTLEALTARVEEPIRLIVVDTVFRAMGGQDENSSEGMGRLIANLDRIKKATGACVLLIHHCGKDATKGARGHSSLRAAADTELEVIAHENVEGKVVGRDVVVRKQRDLDKGDIFGFELKSADVGENCWGGKMTTCLVEGVQNCHTHGKKKPLSKELWHLSKILTGLFCTPVTRKRSMGENSTPIASVTYHEAISELIGEGWFIPHDVSGNNDKPVTREAYKRLLRGLTSLKLNNFLHFDAEFIWLI